METPTTWYYATSNPAKFDDVSRFLAQKAPHVTLLQCDQDFMEPQSLDQKFIAVVKAKQAWDYLQQPVLVDDSGIYLERYNEFPGVFSKFIYQALGLEGIRKLIEPGDRAYFKLHLVFFYGDNEYEIFESICRGSIVFQDRFVSPPSFPWDQFFLPDGSTKTYAELRQGPDAHLFDYRLQAFKRFLEWQQG